MLKYFFIDTNQEIGDRVKFYRLKFKLTQEQLAKDAGMKREYIMDLENGKVNPGYNEICVICHVLGIKRIKLTKESKINDSNIVGEQEVRYQRTKPQSKIAKEGLNNKSTE